MRAQPILRLAMAGAALAVLLLALTVRAAQAAPRPHPNPFVGMVSEDAFGGTNAYRAAVLRRIGRLGVGTVRQTLDWAAVEPRRGRFRWARYDGWVGAAARAGIQVLPILFDAPAWASSRPSTGAARGAYPPRDPADLGAFAAAAVKRYGTGGRFWTTHRGIPYHPITSWQVWNEPNLPVYWQPAPDAVQYTALLRATSEAIKAVDPAAQVLTAGLPQSKLGIPLEAYVQQLYAAGAQRWFDALAVNPYARSASGVIAFLRAMRGIMDANGDTQANLWATEIGWSDRGPGGKFRLGVRGQASAIGSVLPALWRARQELRLQGVIYFNWRDSTPYAGGKDFWGLHTGLLTEAGRPKLALQTFGRAIAQLR